MLHLRTEIDCDVPVADAFRLLCDPERLMRLNPQVNLLSAAPISAGPLAVGSRLRYCLRVPAGTTSFVAEVTAFVPDRLIEFVSDTQPPFRVRQTLEPTLYGCQLIHEEWLTPDAAQLQAAGEERPLLYLLRMLQAAVGLSRPSGEELEQTRRETLRDELQRALGLWLQNIKDHLEASATPLAHNPSATA